MNMKKESETVYIGIHEKEKEEYYVLPYKNGMNVAKITTFLCENVFPGTNYRVEVVNDLSLFPNILWIFNDKKSLYEYFSAP